MSHVTCNPLVSYQPISLAGLAYFSLLALNCDNNPTKQICGDFIDKVIRILQWLVASLSYRPEKKEFFYTPTVCAKIHLPKEEKT